MPVWPIKFSNQNEKRVKNCTYNKSQDLCGVTCLGKLNYKTSIIKLVWDLRSMNVFATFENYPRKIENCGNESIDGACLAPGQLYSCPSTDKTISKYMAKQKTWVDYEHKTLRVRQHGRHFPDDIYRCIFLSENIWISIQISLKFVPKGPINNIPSLVQMMAWRPTGQATSHYLNQWWPSLLLHICVTQPQWVKI